MLKCHDQIHSSQSTFQIHKKFLYYHVMIKFIHKQFVVALICSWQSVSFASKHLSWILLTKMQFPNLPATIRLSLLLKAAYQGLLLLKYSPCNFLKNLPLRVKSCTLRWNSTSHTISWLHLSMTSSFGRSNCPSLDLLQPMSCKDTPVLSNTLIQWSQG